MQQRAITSSTDSLEAQSREPADLRINSLVSSGFVGAVARVSETDATPPAERTGPPEDEDEDEVYNLPHTD